MTFRQFSLAALCCLSVGCAKISPGGGGVGDPCTHTSDCLDPFVCENGVCQANIPTACQPGQLVCNGNQVWECASNGEGFAVQSSCPFGCVEGACLSAFCTPGAERCNGPTIQVCLQDGSGWDTETTCDTSCSTDTTGSMPQCTAEVCSPFAQQCDATDPTKLDTCNGNGTELSVNACPPDEMGNATTCAYGRCLPIVCSVTLAPDGGIATAQQQCDGVVAEQCDITGTQWDPVQVCLNGCQFNSTTGQATCPTPICTPFQQQCSADGTSLLTCDSTGTSQTTTACGSSAVCVNSACQEKVCNVEFALDGGIIAAETQCAGSTLQKCDPNQVSWDTAQFCQYGCTETENTSGGTIQRSASCDPPVCTAGAERCEGQTIQVCLPDGSGWSTEQTCPTTCVAAGDAGKVACSAPVCTPFSTVCDSKITGAVDICNENGTAYTVEDCTTGANGVPTTCVAGECLPVVCSVTLFADGGVDTAQQQCNGAVKEQCDVTGTKWDPVEVCPNGCQFNSATGQASCPPAICTPFATQCAADGITLETCNSTGTAFTSALCAGGTLCVDNTCREKLCNVVTGADGGVIAEDMQCSGSTLQQCDSNEVQWDSVQYCQHGCVQTRSSIEVDGGTLSVSAASCAPEVCTPNSERCEGQAIQVCLSDGSGWSTEETCPTNCVAGVDAGLVECSTPICTPFSTQCSAANSSAIEVCNENGTGLTVEPCAPAGDGTPSTCVDGECLPIVCAVTLSPDGGIESAQQQCNGVVKEQCDPTGTKWDPVQVCPNGCVFDSTTGAASCPAAVCTPFSTVCAADGVTLQTCNAAGTGYTNSTCATGYLCVGDTCSPQLCNVVFDLDGGVDGGIVAAEQECNGSTLLQCDPTQIKWDTEEVCPFGCTQTSAVIGDAGVVTTLQSAACAPPACAVGQTVCSGEALEACQPDQAAFGFVQYCPSGCVEDGGTPTSAYCAAPFCSPLNQQCVGLDGGAQAVEQCTANGTEYQVVQECPEGCLGGVCIVTNDSCTPGDYQCNGTETQLCVQLPGGATQWQFIDHCFGECVSGACTSSAACGCDGMTTGSAAGITCGISGGVQPITLNAAVPVGVSVPCADATATSRIVLYTAPITSAEGVVVPDGTEVTFSNSGSGSLIASTDADPSAPGIQRLTVNGIAEIVVDAPACTSTESITFTASAGGSCGGTTSVSFVAQPDGGTIFVADDFSATTFEDRTVTTAQWNTSISAVVGSPDYSLGTGNDGNLTVSSGTLDLQASNWTPEWDVTGLGTQTATVSAVNPITLVVGDEVLLITVWGPSGSTGPGQYEFKHVTAVNTTTSTITFDAPVQNLYGNGTNANLAGHRVVVQRVAQFNNVTVSTGATLTSAGQSTGSCGTGCTPSGGTGVMTFRARGLVQILGNVTMTGHGLPSGLSSYPNVTPSASLNALVEGNSASSGIGGGIIFIAAGTVSFASNPSGSPLNYSGSTGLSIQSNGSNSSSGAGTVWVQGGTFQFGSAPRVVASTGVNGHCRVDYGASDNTTNPMAVGTGGTTFTGQSGAFVAQTLSDFPSSSYPQTESIGAGNIVSNAALIAVLGGSGTTVYSPALSGQTQVLPGVSVYGTADNGITYIDLDQHPTPASFGAATGTSTGTSFKYKMTLATPSDKPLEIRAIALYINIAP